VDTAIKLRAGRWRNIDYVKIRTFNPYTYEPVSVVLAKELVKKYFKAEGENASFADYKGGDKLIPWELSRI
jgi:isoleucyl-tRNA synthetase